MGRIATPYRNLRKRPYGCWNPGDIHSSLQVTTWVFRLMKVLMLLASIYCPLCQHLVHQSLHLCCQQISLTSAFELEARKLSSVK